jgi:hypothetical protein
MTTMPRYIDADELRKESKMLYSIHAFEPVEAYTQDQIDNAPTLDLVPAPVKCGECRYLGCEIFANPGIYACLKSGNKSPTNITKDLDFYCADGKRKEQK